MADMLIIVRQDPEFIGALGTERLQFYWKPKEKKKAQEVCDLLNQHLKKTSKHRYLVMLYTDYIRLKKGYKTDATNSST